MKKLRKRKLIYGWAITEDEKKENLLKYFFFSSVSASVLWCLFLWKASFHDYVSAAAWYYTIWKENWKDLFIVLFFANF